MRYLLIGAGGLLGTAFHEALCSADMVAAGRHDLGITTPATIEALVRDSRPDVVINCAADTNVDGAESEPEPAYQVNSALPALLGQACRRHGARLVHFSSTGCYGNYLTTAYTEEDPLRPTTVHHRSKASGEQRVRETGCEALILRTGWLYGGRLPKPRNFVRARLAEAKSTSSMMSDTTQFGNPTWVDEVVQQTLCLVEEEISGTFNCVAQGTASRFDYVTKIVALSGRDCEVEPSTQPFVRAAAVSPNESARNFRLDLLGLDRMSPWQEALEHYVEALKSWPEWADLLA